MMSHTILVATFLLLCALSPSYGLKCNEGLNMTLSEIPLHYWTQRNCPENNKCFGQEIAVDLDVAGTIFTTAIRYGACVNSAYANYLDCENLFGADSTFDPAQLLDLLPGAATSFNNSIHAFTGSLPASIIELLSNGNGTADFIDGVYRFYGMLGVNMEKAEPLKPSLANLIVALLNNGSESERSQALMEFFNAFAQLDTDNVEFEAALRSLLNNVGLNNTSIDNEIWLKTIIAKGPGLLRSLFPTNWQLEYWYDVAFKLAGDLDITNLTKTTEDMVATIKSSYPIPDDIAAIINPFLDAMPDLAEGAQVNPAYVGNWSLELLKKFSEEDDATRRLSSAIIAFLETTNGMPLPYELKTTFEWVPGLFYKVFPGDKSVIQEVYLKMAASFESFDFANLTNTAMPTKLSKMIKTITTMVGGPTIFNMSTPEGQTANALVVNFAKMFYDLMNVTDDYTNFIDMFAMVINDELDKFPYINVGTLISNLIKNFGGQVPDEMVPLLENIQNVINVALTEPFDVANLLKALHKITGGYQALYPDSPFPELAERFVNLTVGIATIDWTHPHAVLDLNYYNLEFQYWNIDLQFAIINAQNYSTDELHHMLVQAWPEYGLLIRVLKAMKADDVKELLKKTIEYFLSTPPPHTTAGFVSATKEVFGDITSSIDDLMGDIRQVFTPSSCRFKSCDLDLCNDQTSISSSMEYTKAMTTTTVATMPRDIVDTTTIDDNVNIDDTTMSSSTTMSTTSDGYKFSCNIFINVATLWMAAKLVL